MEIKTKFTAVKLYSLLFLLITLNLSCSSQPHYPQPKNFRYSDINRADALLLYDKMESCCLSPHELTFNEFPDERGWTFEINQKDKAIKLDTGLSPIKAYKLPETPDAYKLSLLTLSLRDRGIACFADCSYMFIPILLFLDHELKPLYTFLPGDLRAHDPTRKPKEQHGYAHRVKIEGNNKAKYFVIYTTPNLIRNSAEFSFTRNAAVYSVNGTAITGAPFGHFVLSIETLEAESPVIK